ncbi:MAG: sel1 repeat family protein [Ruminococcus sp.]|nr:sel1 repeat family protein [Ruminococcus sp.]
MSKKICVNYNADTLETQITINDMPFDTSRINGKEIADWAYPFMVRKVRWDGFYDEMVAALGGEKAFDLVFEGSDEALAELKEAWEDAPVNVISGEQGNTVSIIYDADALATEITVNGQPFDTSRINGKEIEDWVYPFMMRKIKWDGIFDELKAALGTEEYEIKFSGTRTAMKMLMEECPETVTINYQKSGNQTSSSSEAEETYKRAKEYYDNSDYTQAFNYFRKAAEMGHAGAQCDLGDCYDSGEGVKQDQKTAVEWYKKSSAQKYAPGERSLGLCYYYGDGVPQNYTEAVKWLSLAVEQNDAIAQWVLGECYYCGRGVNKDVSKAREYYRRSAEQNDPDGQYNYAVLLCMEDEDEDIDWENGIKWMQKAADAGQEDAIDFLKDIDKTAVSEDAVELENRASALDDEGRYEKSYNLRLRAAELGNIISMSNLGWHYQYGNGVGQDYEKAFSFYKKAADSGNAWAQRKTGICYEEGIGVEQDMAEAVNWYLKAAEQGHAESQWALGICYLNGIGIDEDDAIAVKWFSKSAEQDYVKAESALGDCYLNGYGVEEDEAKAIKWFEKAAIQDDAYSQYMLGIAYISDTTFVQPNPEVALEWFEKSIANGNDSNPQVYMQMIACLKDIGFQKMDRNGTEYKEAAETYPEFQRIVEICEFAINNFECNNPENGRFYLELAIQYGFAEKWDMAVKYSQMATNFGVEGASDLLAGYNKAKITNIGMGVAGKVADAFGFGAAFRLGSAIGNGDSSDSLVNKGTDFLKSLFADE